MILHTPPTSILDSINVLLEDIKGCEEEYGLVWGAQVLDFPVPRSSENRLLQHEASTCAAGDRLPIAPSNRLWMEGVTSPWRTRCEWGQAPAG